MRQLAVACIGIIALGLLVAGCGQGQPVRTADDAVSDAPNPDAALALTPTDDVPPTETVPALPTETPPPTLVPTLDVTATPAPPDALMVAARHMRNGNYRAAAATFEQLVNAGPDDLRADAAFGLGEVALRMGEYGTAVTRFTAFVEAYPADPHTALAYFLRADAHYALNQWSLAADDYRRYLNLRPGRIGSYVHERIGDIQAALGQPADALNSYLAAIDQGRAAAGLLRLREKAASMYLNLGNPRGAAQQYEAILAQARNMEYQADITSRLADALLQAGETQAAYDRYAEVFEAYAETPQAFQAMLKLGEAGRSTTAYQRGLVSYFNEAYQAALDSFYAHLAADPQGSPVIYMYIGMAHRALGAPSDALQAFQEVINRFPDDPLASQAFLEQGRTLFLTGDTANAALRYQELTEAYPNAPEAPEALWRAAYIFETRGENERALASYEILGASYPGAQQAWDGLWLGAQLARTLGDDARAQRLLNMLANSGKGEMQAKGALWLGKLRAAAGDTEGARAAWTLGAQADPDGYYSLRCVDHLLGRPPFDPPPSLQLTFDEGREVAEAEAWLRNTFAITDEAAPLWPLSPGLAADPHLVRGEELWRLGWLESAKAEFNTLLEVYGGDPLATYRLAVYFRELGAYRPSLEAAAAVINMARTNTLGAPRFLARLRYPIYYDDLVIPNADLNGMDPLFAFAVLRLESLFDGFALSYADAYGLMQIIPSTGAYIADQLNWANFTTEQLYYPHVSVTFGVFHLAELLTIFSGDPYAALAGYNAGSGRAADWLDTSGGDPDLYVETVAFEQTRLYIKIISENYRIYRALYGGD
ncbi:MAG: hypothetical protein Kow00120_04400 [Anaerolineae bacterium]